MNQKNTLILLLSLTMLASCSPEKKNSPSLSNPSDKTSVSNSDTSKNPSPTSTKGTYTKLKEGLEAFTTSFTLKGTVVSTSSYSSQGSSDEYQETNNCLLEVSQDAYYYEESDQATDDLLTSESFYKGDGGKFHSHELNLLTNQVMDIPGNELYDEKMTNPFHTIEVKNVKGIRKMPDWYEFTNNEDKKSLAYFLTGYEVTKEQEDGMTLNVTQLAFHYDGDQIDRFRIQLDASSGDDDYQSAYQFLFELDSYQIGNTIPRTIKPYAHSSEHDQLKAALDKIRNAENYTISFSDHYVSSPNEDEEYEYRIDKENIFCNAKRSREFTLEDEKGEKTTKEYDYYLCYKNVATVEGKDPYVISFNANEPHEVLQSKELNAYLGEEENHFRFIDLLPYFSYLSADCFKEEDGYFTTYLSTYDYCIGALLPVFEQSSGYELKVYLDSSNENIAKVTMEGNVTVGESTKTKLVRTITYQNLSTTIIPDYLSDYQLGETK